MENKIKAKVGKKVKAPEYEEYGVELHEVRIDFWPDYKRRGRKPNATV